MRTARLLSRKMFNCRKAFSILTIAFVSFVSTAKADYTIASGTTVDASTLTGQSGILTIDGTLLVTSNQLLNNFTTVIINSPSGQIYWQNNSDLSFNASVTITVNEGALGLQPTSGNASKRLIVGTTIIAVSNDNSNNAAFSFEDFNGAGGLPQFFISTSVSAICSNSSFTATITPLNNTVNYDCVWAISGAGTKSPASQDNFNSPQTTTITPSGTGTYTISCTVYKAGDDDLIITKTKTVTVNNAGTWLGVNTDWNSPLNWCNGSVPTSSTNVSIPNGLSFYPIINGSAYANNITVATGGSASVTVTGTLKIAGAVTSAGGINATSGTIEFIGTTSQSIRADNFTSSSIANLKVTNTLSTASAGNPSVSINAAGGMLQVSGTISFGNLNNAFLQTNDQLTLLSSATTTAAVADITNNNLNSGNSIIGKIVIERFIPAKRAWRLLTAPVTPASQVKMSDAWQEGAARVTSPSVINAANNPNPGYGTHITYGSPALSGYDQGPNGNTSICYLTTTGWNGVPTATNNGSTFNSGYITDQPGYMLFVRGDRSTQLSAGTGAATTSTTLRVKGSIYTGSLNINLATALLIGSSKFRVVSNPYPSAVNFHKIIANSGNNSGGFTDAFYLWDPNITGSNGVGGWVAMSYNSATGLYDRNIVSSSISNNGDIQSGSAFLIDYAGMATSLQVKESNKSTGSSNSQFRPAGQPNQLRVTLLAKNSDNTNSVNDGLLVSFDDSYSNSIDNADMKKIANFAENFAVVNEATSLVIEKRKSFIKTDSIHFKMTKMKQKNYQLEFMLDDLNAPEGTTAVLEDKFLDSKTVLDLKTTSRYDFSVTGNAASVNAERFSLVFKQAAEFKTVAGTVQEQNVIIDWSLYEEFNLDHYEIERSAVGNIFSVAGTMFSKGNSDQAVNYSWTDIGLSTGNYSYRIKAISKNGVAVYSNKVDIKIINSRPGMYVFPNPVTGNNIQLQMNKVLTGI